MALQLVVVNGPLEGETYSVEGQVVIGRSRPGIVLPDHTVSIKHARIEPSGEGLVIVDLGSKTGTKVNGRTIAPEAPVPLDIGDRVEIGETEFKVDSIANRMFGRVIWLMIPAWALVAAALVVLYIASGPRPLVLEFSEPVEVPQPTSQLEVPPAFARTHGLALDRITLLDVRDDDGDGIDEIWLGKDDQELVVTFDEQGTWLSRGEVPRGCTPRFNEGAPQVDCGGTLYQVQQDRYIPALQEGVVVWVRGKASGLVKAAEPEPAGKKGKKNKGKRKNKAGEPEPEPEPPKKKSKKNKREDGMVEVEVTRGLDHEDALIPYRVQLLRPSLLAGFLSERGVHGPVHYILCEDQGLGRPAQVRLPDGTVRELNPGCGDALKLDGLQADAFGGSQIVAVAFTATGWKLLPRDLSMTTTGASNDLIATEKERKRLKLWEELPRSAISYDLQAKAIEMGFTPVAREDQALEPRMLLGPDPAGRARGGVLLNRGVADLEVAGCTYRVRTHYFRCALIRGCLPGTAFVSVVEKGCGEDKVVLKAGYSDGMTRTQSAHALLQLDVDTSSAAGVTEVVRAQIGVRPLKP